MSDPRVTSLITQKTTSPPHPADPDPWHAFRQVEIITLELAQHYKHSLGKYSRFFIELEHQRFFGTQCPTCQKVFTPPRPLCPDCLQITDWVELPGSGTMETFAVMHYTSGANDDVNRLETPIALVYVLMDGSSTLFPHLLKIAPENIKLSMRVRVAYADTPVSHPLHLMYFVPMED